MALKKHLAPHPKGHNAKGKEAVGAGNDYLPIKPEATFLSWLARFFFSSSVSFMSLNASVAEEMSFWMSLSDLAVESLDMKSLLAVSCEMAEAMLALPASLLICSVIFLLPRRLSKIPMM